MISQELLIIIVFLALATGAALGQYWRASWIRRNKQRIRREAKNIIADARRAAQSAIVSAELEAKELSLAARNKIELEQTALREELRERERLLNQSLGSIAAAEERVARERTRLESAETELNRRQESCNEREVELAAEWKSIAGFSKEEARDEILRVASAKLAPELELLRVRAIQEAEREAQTRARAAITNTLERVSKEIISERSAITVALPDEEMRGRIIGRDGRNVRAFESITGVDVLLDEIPGHVLLSSYSPERREVAKVALVRLMEDGRIQPSRIEQLVAEARRGVTEGALEFGQKAAEETGVGPLPDALATALGRLKFRASHLQNVYLHSIETAQIAGLLAAELGFAEREARLLRRAALLHDIGKGFPEEVAKSHALAAADYLTSLGEDAVVVNAVAAHHREVADETLLAQLLRVADYLSGARPGARRDDGEVYVLRLAELEALAQSFPGVERAYAFQAGRELHVVVDYTLVDDARTHALAQEISKAAAERIKMKGEIKVTVIREVRVSQLISPVARF